MKNYHCNFFIISICKKNDIIISIEDTGSGIKDEDKNLILNENEGRIINLQYQDNKFGTGYGLKITHIILKKLNHRLIVSY